MAELPVQTPAPATLDPAAIEKAKDLVVEQAKQSLIESLGGKTTNDTPPATWGDLRSEMHQTASSVKEEAVQEARKVAQKIIEDREKAQQDEQRKSYEQKAAELQEQGRRLADEWKEAVSDGLLPAINPEVQKKLQEGTQYSALSPEEQKDPGIVAYQRAFAMHQELAQKGQSTSFYRTIQKFFNAPPAGTRAPVFGQGAAAQPQDDGNYSYADVVANRKKFLKF